MASQKELEIKTRLLRDKACHVYLLVALKDTEFNLKELSARMGLGKKVLVDVPEDLRSPLLAASPRDTVYAAGVPGARQVAALVDHSLAPTSALQMPSLDGSGVTSTTGSEALEYLRRHCGSVTSVDFGNKAKVGRDNPPDLAEVVAATSVVTAVKEAVDAEIAAAAQAEAAAAAARRAGTLVDGPTPAAATAKSKPSTAAKASTAVPVASPTDVNALVISLVDRVLAMSRGSGVQPGGSSSEARQAIETDVRLELTALKNASYASGYEAARGALRMLLQ